MPFTEAQPPNNQDAFLREAHSRLLRTQTLHTAIIDDEKSQMRIIEPRYKLIKNLYFTYLSNLYVFENLNNGREVVGKHTTDAPTEAKMMARLKHPHIATVLDVAINHTQGFGTSTDDEYIILERYPKNLQEVIAQGISFPTLAHYIGQISSALEYVHKHGIVYADLCSRNILLDDFGDVQLTDFGIARLIGKNYFIAQSMGSKPIYSPPEQNHPYHPHLVQQSDVYAFGVLLFEMFSGQAFTNEHEQTLENFQSDPDKLIPLAKNYAWQFNSQAHQQLSSLLHQAINKYPWNRQKTIAQLNDEVQFTLANATPGGL